MGRNDIYDGGDSKRFLFVGSNDCINKGSCLQVITHLHGRAHGAQVIER
jgi:hypothetical protein